MDIDAIKKYYSDLLITQYRTKARAVATIKELVNVANQDDIIGQLLSCFDIDSAVGPQLDILGKIVGVKREVYGLDLEHSYFSFTRYDGSPASIGFGRYTDNPYSEDLFLRYNTWAIYTLTDFELRALIKLRIIFNSAFSSFKNIKESLYAAFSGGIDVAEPSPSGESLFSFTRFDGTPASVGFGRFSDDPYSGNIMRYAEYEIMKLDYFVKPVYAKAWAAAEFLGLVPKPMGVKYETHLI